MSFRFGIRLFFSQSVEFNGAQAYLTGRTR